MDTIHFLFHIPIANFFFLLVDFLLQLTVMSNNTCHEVKCIQLQYILCSLTRYGDSSFYYKIIYDDTTVSV